MNIFAMLRIFLTGLCMGAADLIPGISGGTIAFIMGIYEPLISSIKSVSIKNICERKLPWRFLCSLLTGMACSFLLFSHAVAHFLNDGNMRTLLYAAFTGLIVASILFLARQIRNWEMSEIVALIVGGTIAYFLSGQQFAHNYHAEVSSSLIQPWLIFSGAAAISAMLLPGISGSYLLMILGVYPLALEALTDFSAGIGKGTLDTAAMIVLINILLGIFFGAVLFSRVISWLYSKYQCVTVAMLIGFMIGAMPTAWPFWDFTYIVHPFKPEKGLVPMLISPIMPDVTSSLFLQACFFAGIGFSAVFILNYIANAFRVVNSKQS